MKSVHDFLYKILYAHSFGFGVFVLFVAFFLFAGGYVMANSQTLSPTDSHIVSLYINGQEQIVPTRAETVGDFLNRMDVKLKASDIVEPELKTNIDADNFRIRVYVAKPVVIVDGNNIKKIETPYTSPRLIAEKAGIKLYPEDKLDLTLATNFVKESILGEKLVIDRATVVTFSLYGSPPAVYRTQAGTVREFLNERKIVPEEGATISPDYDTPISDNLPIFLSKFGKKVAIVEEIVPFATEHKVDPNKPIGYKQIIKAGVNGKKQVIYELDVDTDQESSRKIIQEVIVVPPISQEMIVGGKFTGFNGDFSAALARLRSCEGAYTSNTSNGYYGAYQFNLGTWRSNAPSGYENMLPSNAPPAVQDKAAATLYERRGWQPWPACSRALGLLDIYR